MSNADCDIAIIGGGFYGCCLGLFLRSLTPRISIFEAENALLTRASRVNQARVHTGFHYPRSFVTALRSKALQARFAADFESAIVSDFEMLYAIATRRSKVSAGRFLRVFQEMNAPIEVAVASRAALFNRDLIEEVFKCREFAFDWSKLRAHLIDRLDRHKVDLHLETTVRRLAHRDGIIALELDTGHAVTARFVFNMTYSNINHILQESGLSPLGMKHEFTEVALITPPEELEHMAVTVMDGPFFSSMPYPAEKLYSLTHVRYTPHYSWGDQPGGQSPYAIASKLPQATRWRHMVADAERYMPCFKRVTYRKSLFEVKTILLQNEKDDGRPILFRQHKDFPNLVSIMGGKIDNIYDLFDAVTENLPEWRSASDQFLIGDSTTGIN